MTSNLIGASTLLFIVLIGQNATAELNWDAMERQVDYTSDEMVLTTRFCLRNDGDKTIAVSRVTTSCSCVQTTVSREHFQPGETGEIVVTINRRGRGSVFKRTVAVKTDDGKTSILVVHVMPALGWQIDPRFVWWGKGEKALGKELVVKVSAETEDLRISSSDPQFIGKVERGADLTIWKVTISPTSTDTTRVGILTFEAISRGTRPSPAGGANPQSQSSQENVLGRSVAYAKVL